MLEPRRAPAQTVRAMSDAHETHADGTVSIGVGGYGVAARLTGPRDLVDHLLSAAPPGLGRRALHDPPVAHYVVDERSSRRFWRDLQLVVATHSTTHVFIHAGAVAIGGRVLLIPGRSHTGKSTLVWALLELGATYLSDEYALLDRQGWCHPYPRPLSLRGEPGTPPTQALATTVAQGKARVVAIVVTEFRPGAAWSPRPLSPGETVLALMDNAVSARVRTAEVLESVTAVARGARGIASERDEAQAVAEWLVTELDRLDDR